MTSPYHHLLSNAIVWQELEHQDEVEGERLRCNGCSVCGGKLDRAYYPRRPRGHRFELGLLRRRRVSFCCRNCRKRNTPVSVRFLSGKVYSHISLFIELTLRSGRSPGVRLSTIRSLCGASEVTIRRWQKWILAFLRSPEWKLLRAKLAPPFDERRFPASLLETFHASANSLTESIRLALRFLGTLSVKSEVAR
jgi:hypothetical protein